MPPLPKMNKVEIMATDLFVTGKIHHAASFPDLIEDAVQLARKFDPECLQRRYRTGAENEALHEFLQAIGAVADRLVRQPCYSRKLSSHNSVSACVAHIQLQVLSEAVKAVHILNGAAPAQVVRKEIQMAANIISAEFSDRRVRDVARALITPWNTYVIEMALSVKTPPSVLHEEQAFLAKELLDSLIILIEALQESNFDVQYAIRLFDRDWWNYFNYCYAELL